ncbi:MAG: T9SS type A sorting domain-containing protein, partial [Bacteroidota bacterium]
GGYIIGAQDGNWPLYIELEQNGSILDTAYIGNTYPYPYNFKSQDHFQNNDTIYGCGYYDDGHNYPIIFNLDSEYDLMDSVILYNDFPHVAIGQKIVFCRDSQSFVIAGRYDTEKRGDELFIQKATLSLESKWYHSIGSIKSDNVHDLIATDDGGYLIVGETDGFTDLSGLSGIYLVKTDSMGEGNYTSPVPQIQSEQSGIKIFPNPADNKAWVIIPENIEVKEILIHDVAGKLHIKNKVESKHIELNLDRLKSGIYIVSDNKNQFREKLLVY